MNWQIIVLSVITGIIGIVFLVKCSRLSPTLYQAVNSFLWGIAFIVGMMSVLFLEIMQYVNRLVDK